MFERNKEIERIEEEKKKQKIDLVMKLKKERELQQRAKVIDEIKEYSLLKKDANEGNSLNKNDFD